MPVRTDKLLSYTIYDGNKGDDNSPTTQTRMGFYIRDPDTGQMMGAMPSADESDLDYMIECLQDAKKALKARIDFLAEKKD